MESRTATERPATERDWWWIFDPRLSLRARAALIFGGSTIAFTVAFSSLAGKIFQRSIEQQVGASFDTMAFQVSDKLDRAIFERYRELLLVAGLAPFRSSEASNLERRRLLEAVQNSAREFAWIGFADAKGRVIAATRGIFENTPVEARSWFLIGRERPYAGNLSEMPALAQALSRLEEDRSARFLDLAVPVMGEDGRFLGVLGAHLSWDWARDVQASVITEAARRQRIGATVYSMNGDVLLDSGASGWTLPPDAPTSMEARALRGSFIERTSLGTTYLTGFARSRGQREYRGLGWLTTVRQPIDLALAPARELQQRIVIWGSVFAITLVLLSWWAAGKFARRLRAIGIAANRIREGDVLTVMPRAHGDSEMSRMCGALGEMVDELRAKQDARSAESGKPAVEAKR